MRFGLILPSFSFPDLDFAKAARLRDFAQRAEVQGYEALWVVEHLLTARGLYGTAWLSPLETVAFAAGCTTGIKLATGILIAALLQRHACDLVFMGIPADTDAEFEAAARQVL